MNEGTDQNELDQFAQIEEPTQVTADKDESKQIEEKEEPVSPNSALSKQSSEDDQKNTAALDDLLGMD